MEYEEYTMDVTKIEKPCLKYLTLIKGNFSGLTRALTIIARHEIFPNNVYTEDFDEEKVKAVLRAWFGFKYDEKYSAHIKELNIENWLGKYIREVFLKKFLEKAHIKSWLENKINSEIDSENFFNQLRKLKKDEFELESELKNLENECKAKIDELKKNGASKEKIDAETSIGDYLNRVRHTISALYTMLKRTYYLQSMFSPNYVIKSKDSSTNDYYQISFENIIANAFYLGPLRRYYLVCNVEKFWDSIGRYTGGSSNKKNLSDGDKDLILKMTIAYLLQREYQNPLQEYVVINKTDMFHWRKEDTKPENFGLGKYQFNDPRGRIFSEIKINNNINKLKIDPKWIEKFKLEDAENFKPNGEIFFSDTGAGSHIVKDKDSVNGENQYYTE